MSAFKDMVMRDRDILLNPDEIGEEHEVDGKTVICVIDDSELVQESNTVYMVSRSQKTLFAKCEDLPKRRGYGAELMVDGVPYIVQSWSEGMGMAQIVLSIAVGE
ncbi:MAG: sugar ABC transporter ATP-binding protein [Ruminococcus sp.]|nr:sugar ABC transporter ATP-binding protein [Ruminococcus sp.]